MRWKGGLLEAHWEIVNEQNLERCIGFGATLHLGSRHQQININVMCLGYIIIIAT